ncbi:hypothetical protein BKA62DRAFT_737476, partial [Auriculariales sp. MPI-PUGE-AT-0066]
MLWLLVALALAAIRAGMAVEIPAADNDAWQIDGKRGVLNVVGCTTSKKALLLFAGASASYTFNGTGVDVVGAMYADGMEATVTVDGADPRTIDAHSDIQHCVNFAQFQNLDPGKAHTIKISASSNAASNKSVFPLMVVDVHTGPRPPPPVDPTLHPLPPDAEPTKSTSSTTTRHSTSSHTKHDSQTMPTGTSGSDSLSTMPTSTSSASNDSAIPGNDAAASSSGADDDATTPTINTTATTDPSDSLFIPSQSDESSSSKGVGASTLVPAIALPIIGVALIGWEPSFSTADGNAPRSLQALRFEWPTPVMVMVRSCLGCQKCTMGVHRGPQVTMTCGARSRRRMGED